MAPESHRSPETLLKGTVIPSRQFAAAMRVLGSVVESDFVFRAPDRSAYRAWLLEQYLKELPQHLQVSRLQSLMESEQEQASRASKLQAEADSLALGVTTRMGEDYLLARKNYWAWLYEHDLDQWVVLDPVITVAPETVFFEALSADESSYIRVSLPITEIETSGPVGIGCTNIDYSTSLDRVLARARSYRPLQIEVSEAGLRIGSVELLADEGKVDPPESWMRSFAEVQAVFGLAPHTLEVSPGFLADVIAAIRARRTQGGPRALVFHLAPQQPIQAELQPWGITITDRRFIWEGQEARTIKVWGRRRLTLLAPLLPEATAVRVDLIGDGLPSSWTVMTGEIYTTLVLSGWTSREWAGRASFLGATSVSQDHADVVETRLRAAGSATLAELAASTDLGEFDTQQALGALSRSGRATRDLTTGKYIARMFPFAPGSSPKDSLSLAERKARELIESADVTTRVVSLNDGGLEVTGTFRQDSRTSCSLVLDEDRRLRKCTCSCPDFQFHGLRNGPCCHLMAALGAM